MDRDTATELLVTHGIQPTQQRVEITQMLFACPQHLSAEQILAQVNEQGAVVSKATVYNTLGLFAQKGLLREVIIDPNRVFYDTNTEPHHHFYHMDTGELTDIAEDEVDITHLPSAPEGLVTEGVEVIIRVRRVPTTP